MGLFVESEGDVAIISMAGVYKQVEVFTRDGYLYAKANGGFIRLMADGSTSKSMCRLDHLVTDLPLARDTYGKLCVSTNPGAKPLLDRQRAVLLGGPSEDA